MQEIIKDLKKQTKRYRKAIKFLDGCKDFDFEDYKKAWRMTGSDTPESELRQMWAGSRGILSGPGIAGGTDSLRDLTREALMNGINEADALLARMRSTG